jgi:hypothetical protein
MCGPQLGIGCAGRMGLGWLLMGRAHMGSAEELVLF